MIITSWSDGVFIDRSLGKLEVQLIYLYNMYCVISFSAAVSPI